MANIDFSKVYSYSKLEKFKKCPLDYYFYYLDPEWKGFQKPKDYKTKGSAVHNAITLFYHLKPEERNLSNLRECLYQAWFSEVDPAKEPPLGEIGGFNNIFHERKTYWEALRMLKNFFNLEDTNPQLFYLPTKDIKHSFGDYQDSIQPLTDGVFISGKFDRIDKLENNTLRIVDFKTGKNSQDRSQLDFYALLAELNFDLEVSTASFYYLNEGKIIDFRMTDAEKKKVKKQILERIEIIESTKKFTPNPSRLCSHCDFKPICPVFKK